MLPSLLVPMRTSDSCQDASLVGVLRLACADCFAFFDITVASLVLLPPYRCSSKCILIHLATSAVFGHA